MQQSGNGQGNKTHEQFLRQVERKDDVPKGREMEGIEGRGAGGRTPNAESRRRAAERDAGLAGRHEPGKPRP